MATGSGRARAALVAAGVAVAAGAVGWAASTVFAPPAQVPEAQFAIAAVVPGEVSSTIRLLAVAEWSPGSSTANQASGVVTSVDVAAGSVVPVGTTLYTVSLRPVVIARGTVPAFRALAPGTAGADVAQLQAFLTETGYYSGVIDGDYGAGTATAVQAWQSALGVDPDGVVQAGDVVFVPDAPARVVLDDSIAVGETLAGGERAVGVLASEPRFTLTVSAAQAASIPEGARVDITGPAGETWIAAAGTRTTTEEGDVVVALVSETGVCADACASIPVGEPVSLDAGIVMIEPTSGLTVPSAALRTAADGRVLVVDVEGEEHPVTVVASAQGMSVVEGVVDGLRVRIPLESE